MFRRRTKRSYTRTAFEALYPRGGWPRAVSYLMHRLQRLPDPPHKIARGIAVGVFVCFTPFYGFHFVLAIIFSFMIQGNYLASLIATFFGNPLTFPIIATVSIEVGAWMLGQGGGLMLPQIVGAFSHASVELWANFTALFTPEVVHWDRSNQFWRHVFLPYLVGGIAPGLIVSVVAYIISVPLISTYQTRRIRRLKKRYEKKRFVAASKADLDAKTD